MFQFCVKAKKYSAFRGSATSQKIRVFFVHCAHDKFYIHDRKNWRDDSMTIREEPDPDEIENFIVYLNRTDSLELNQYFVMSPRPKSQVQAEKNKLQSI